jgi:hypothetical protein
LPGIPLLLPLGRRPVQARFESSTLRAEINASIGMVFDPSQAGETFGSDPDFNQEIVVCPCFRAAGREEVR